MCMYVCNTIYSITYIHTHKAILNITNKTDKTTPDINRLYIA